MTTSSVHPPGLPLPPNRRLKKSKARSALVEAPDERIPEGPLPPENDPELESDESTEANRARWKEGLRLAAGVVVTVAAALACVWGLLNYTRTSPRFAVRSIDVHGTSRRSAEDIARRAGIAIGQNVFVTDLEAARAGILNDPWIEQASLRRRLPAAISVDVVEREAAALVAIGPDLYLSTRQGEPFKKPEIGDPYDLPVVTGISTDDVVKDRVATIVSIRRALDLVADYDHLGPAKSLPVQEVHLEDDGGLVLSVGKDVIQLHMGKGPYRQGLEQASRVLGELANRRAQASVVFLDNDAHPERVVVRMR
jgi:cell division protein FtsQ